MKTINYIQLAMSGSMMPAKVPQGARFLATNGFGRLYYISEVGKPMTIRKVQIAYTNTALDFDPAYYEFLGLQTVLSEDMEPLDDAFVWIEKE